MTLTATEPLQLAEAFALAEPPGLSLRSRFNIAPTQDVLVVASSGPRSLRPMRWGLVPSWAEDLKIGARMINARAETIAEKPAFRAAFARRRCLVAVDGWYEWRTDDSEKRPFHLRRPDRAPFALAGVHESWSAPDGSVVASCAVVTTSSNAALEGIHDRMPVVLPRESFDLWLAAAPLSVEDRGLLLRPCPDSWIVAVPASSKVGNVRNDGPELLQA